MIVDQQSPAGGNPTELAVADVAPRPDSYTYGPAGKRAQWDGHAWTGSIVADAQEPGLPKWHRHVLPFLRHRWFWAMVVGTVLSTVPGYLAAAANSPALALLCVFGFAVFMYGGVELIAQHEYNRQLPNRRSVVVWGLVSGFVAFVIASIVEGVGLGLTSFGVELWLAGPIEETSKLLLPIILWLSAGSRFRDPRAGLLMVLTSGAVFGGIEAITYVLGSQHYGMLTMVLIRPTSELLHPLLTGFAAAVIWLAAWRAGRLITIAGVVAWAIAMFIHSFHDGYITFFEKVSASSASLNLASVSEAIELAIPTLLNQLVWVVIIYFICRHAAREVRPPTGIDSSAPGWRPAIRKWGVKKPAASAVASTPAEPQ